MTKGHLSHIMNAGSDNDVLEGAKAANADGKVRVRDGWVGGWGWGFGLRLGLRRLGLGFSRAPLPRWHHLRGARLPPPSTISAGPQRGHHPGAAQRRAAAGGEQVGVC